jgi:hypothetical protein
MKGEKKMSDEGSKVRALVKCKRKRNWLADVKLTNRKKLLALETIRIFIKKCAHTNAALQAEHNCVDNDFERMIILM